MRVGGSFVVGCTAFFDGKAQVAWGRPSEKRLGVLQHQAALPPQRGVGGNVAGEGLRLVEQGVEDEQATVGVSPQGLFVRVGGGEAVDLRPDLVQDELEELRCTAVAAFGCQLVRHGFALRVGRGVVVGAGGGIEAQFGRVADEGEDGQLFGREFEAFGGEVFEQGVAVKCVKGGEAAGGRGGFGNADEDAVRPVLAVFDVERVEGVGVVLLREDGCVGAAGDFVVGRRCGGNHARGGYQGKGEEVFVHGLLVVSGGSGGRLKGFGEGVWILQFLFPFYRNLVLASQKSCFLTEAGFSDGLCVSVWL